MEFEIEPIGLFSREMDSNFMFRAIAKAIALTEGDAAVDGLVSKAIEDASFAISNPLPIIENKLFVPIQQQLFESKVRNFDVEKKVAKKIRYIEFSKLHNFLWGDVEMVHMADSNMQIYGFEEKRLKAVEDSKPHLHIMNIIRNRVPRVPKVDDIETEIYSEKQMLYDGVRFLVYASCADKQLEEKVRKGLVMLSYLGLGGGRTVGRGFFKMKEANYGIEKHLKKEKCGILISSLKPSQGEVEAIDWENSNISYELSKTVTNNGLFMDSAMMISAGSQICSNGQLPVGTIKIVESAGQKGVYFGRGIYI